MEKYICIHGHFYQPPRENPWLESVELQDSAWPYHDWDERITAECYAPNAWARILNGDGRISSISSNYGKISFNFGPTLLAWMKEKELEVHAGIIESDRLSRERYSGHGSAIAQAYNHMILPLANERDKYTQVLWGVRDFEARFGRAPEGMWLAETAADTDTLDVMALLGIKFTILSPFQASRAREVGKRHWRDVNGGQIDPTRPYLVRLREGRSMAVFFYDGPVSQAVAFEKLLGNGERLANRLLGAFEERNRDQLVHIATDGESYGHHHKHGEMALAYALHYIEEHQLAKLTNYGEYLEKHPPTHEAQIHEKSAWSCVHGVGRWMSDCGCNSGREGWNQGWRAPLRESLDWLRDELAPLFEERARPLLKDPWGARNDYIAVILDRTKESREKFFEKHRAKELQPEEQVHVLKLMEIQRHAMLMYTSCGWFFDELSGIETVQVVQYAARAMQLAKELFDRDLETPFLERFAKAKSNIPENGDGRTIYEKFVRPAMVDRTRAAAHYAISSVFTDYPDRTRIFSYTFQDEHHERVSSGKTSLVIGRSHVVSEITQASDVMHYAVLYMGEHNLTGGVVTGQTLEQYEQMRKEVRAAYESADFPDTIRQIDKHFGQTPFSLKSLFKDEQRRILDEILASTREDLEGRFRLIRQRYEPLMKFLHGVGAPLPQALQVATDLVLHGDLLRELDAPKLNPARIEELMRTAEQLGGRVLDAEMGYAMSHRLEKELRSVAEHLDDLEQLTLLEKTAALVQRLPSGLNLAKAQNVFWEMQQKIAPSYREKAAAGDAAAQEWMREFTLLGQKLAFDLPDPSPQPLKTAA